MGNPRHRSTRVTSCFCLYITTVSSVCLRFSPINHEKPPTPARPLVLRDDPRPRSSHVGGYPDRNVRHLARPWATQVCQHGWVDRVHIRHWGRHPQTTFYCLLLYHGRRIRHHPNGGTVAHAKVWIQNPTVVRRTVLTLTWVDFRLTCARGRKSSRRSPSSALWSLVSA